MDRRFPDAVHAVLTAAGWRPGRDVSAQVEQWLASVYADNPEARERLLLFPAARAALTEFGGLFPLHQVGEFLVGDNLDDAVMALVAAAELKEVDDHGNVIEDAWEPGRNC